MVAVGWEQIPPKAHSTSLAPRSTLTIIVFQRREPLKLKIISWSSQSIYKQTVQAVVILAEIQFHKPSQCHSPGNGEKHQVYPYCQIYSDLISSHCQGMNNCHLLLHSPGATNSHESSESSIRCCFNKNYLTCDYRTIVLTKYFCLQRNIWVRSNYFSRTCWVAHREDPSHLCYGIFKGAERPKALHTIGTTINAHYHGFSMTWAPKVEKHPLDQPFYKQKTLTKCLDRKGQPVFYPRRNPTK